MLLSDCKYCPSKSVLVDWESALYGSIMIGWGITLFLAGRIAFRRRDFELKMALLYGIFAWLALEGIFSVYLGVWFNVVVDIAVLFLFSIPLLQDGSKSDM